MSHTSDEEPLRPGLVLSLRAVLPGAAAALLSGVLLSLAFPPADVVWLSWLALIPLLWALGRVRRARDGFFLGLLAGGAFFALLLLFIGQYGMLPWLALAAYQALYIALFGALAVPLLRLRSAGLRVAALGSLWALVELARGRAGPLAFTFGDLGLTLHEPPQLLQSASLIGGYGLSFLVATFGAACAAAFFPDVAALERHSWPLVVCAAVLVALTAWGALELRRRPAEPTFSVVAVQNNEHSVPGVHLADSWEQLALNAALSERAVRPETDLVLWSETAVTALMGPGTIYHDEIAAVARRLGTWLLAGGLDTAPHRGLHNAAYLFAPSGRATARYYKSRLVIFGEYVPFRDRLKFLERYPIRDEDILPGPGPTVLDVGGVPCGPMICFESIFPEISRETVQRGAQVLVIMTSDAWAGHTPEVWQHAYCSVLRAVENRRPLVRCASTGVTCAIDANGRLVAVLPTFEAGALTARVAPGRVRTLYNRLGDGPLAGVWLLILIAAAWRLRRDRRKAPAAPEGDEQA